jgi:hypothetical protein
MAKKKGLAAAHKRSRKNNSIVAKAKSNPPPLQDVMEFVVPGFVGYAGTRFASRIVHGVISKRFPKLAKHASVLSTFGAAGLAWLAVHRIERVKQYHTPVVVGASIAAIQTAVQAYLPKYGWMVSDHDLNNQLPAAQKKSTGPIVGGMLATATQATPEPTGSLPPSISALTVVTPTTLHARQQEVALEAELDELDMGILSSGWSEEGAFSDAELEDALN